MAAIQEPVGTPFSGTIATFTGSIPADLRNQLTYSIQWGDDSRSTGTPSFGSGTLSVADAHAYSAVGPYPFTVELLWGSQVIVSAGGSASIGGVAPPVANNDDYATAMGQTLTITARQGAGQRPGFERADAHRDQGRPRRRHGSVALNADGSFTYTPNPGFAGPDSFSYQASDGSLISNVATVSLAVFNGAPSPATRSTPPYTTGRYRSPLPGCCSTTPTPLASPSTAVPERRRARSKAAR